MSTLAETEGKSLHLDSDLFLSRELLLTCPVFRGWAGGLDVWLVAGCYKSLNGVSGPLESDRTDRKKLVWLLA